MTPTSPTIPPAAPPVARPRRWRRPLGWAVVACVLAAVFASYLNPHLMVALLNPIWSCF